MNAEKLHAIARAIVAELDQTHQVQTLTELETALTNQVSAPQEPSFQQQVAEHFAALLNSLAEAPSNDFPAAWRQTLEDLGIVQLIGNALGQRISEIFGRNQITTSVAKDEIAEINRDVQALAESVRQLDESLDYFGIGAEELEPGTAEVSVLIPRPAVNEELKQLGGELEEIAAILNPFLELADGSREPLKVSSISSSDFGVFVLTSAASAYAIAKAINEIILVYKNVIDIRHHRQGLIEAGVPAADLEALDARANGTMALETERIARELVAESNVTNAERANELTVEIRMSLNKIANRIDDGYNIDVRAEPEPEPEPEGEDSDGQAAREPSENQQFIEAIREIAPNLAFMNRTGKPILSLPESPADEEQDGAKSPPPRKRGAGKPAGEADS